MLLTFFVHDLGHPSTKVWKVTRFGYFKIEVSVLKKMIMNEVRNISKDIKRQKRPAQEPLLWKIELKLVSLKFQTDFTRPNM
jgi:hypothetical protein